MNQVEAKRFADAIEAESYDEKIGLKHSGPPMSMGRKAPPGAMGIREQGRVDALKNKIIGIFQERLSVTNESEALNQQISAKLDHGLPELTQKSQDEKNAMKQELLMVVHGLLDFLCGDEVKLVDTVTAAKLSKALEEGTEIGYREAEKGYKAEFEKLKIGTDPLSRSLAERLK
jgi:hypothetical protein